jgi:hypothetical protein
VTCRTFRVLGIILALSSAARGQQTIFNVPSADLTDPHTFYFEHESQFRAWSPGRYWFGTDYIAYGIGHDTEVDVNLFNTTVPASGNISGAAGFRSVIPILAKTAAGEEFKWTVGGQALMSLEGAGPGYWVYSHLSGRLPKVKTRLTAGISAGTAQLFGRDTVHFIGGVEQSISKTFSLIGDWFSGTQSLGYSTFGVGINLPKRFGLCVGYQVPNSGKVGKTGFTIEVTKLF